MTSEDIQNRISSKKFWQDYLLKNGQNHIPTSTGKSWMYNDALNPITSGRRPGSTDDGYDRMRDFGYVQTGYNREYAGYSMKRKQRR